MDPAKIESIKKWLMPTMVREVQVFLGIANYHWKFIRGFLETARPLTQLTKKDHPFI